MGAFRGRVEKMANPTVDSSLLKINFENLEIGFENQNYDF
jgi:hypothetical protein